MKRKISMIVGAVAVLGLVTACASNGDTEQPTGEPTSPTQELTTVTVGVTPNADIAPLFLGAAKGFYEEEGIDIQTQPVQGGAVALTAVVSGDVNIGFSANSTIITAHAQGLEVKIVAPGAYSTGEAPDTAAVAAAPGSGITSPSDLEGRTVATNGLGNIFETTVNYVMEQHGADPSTVRWIEMAWPDMPAALASGQIDAGVLSEPFLTMATDIGATPVLWNWFDTDPELWVASYFSNAAWVEDNPEVAAAFVRATNKSLEYAAANEAEVRDILTTYTELSDDVREKMTMARFSTNQDVRTLQLIADLNFEAGLQPVAVDVTELLIN